MNTLFLIIVVQVYQLVRCVDLRTKEREILDYNLSPERYDVRIRPPGTNATDNAATVVNVNLFVRSISSLDDNKMEYKVQLTFRQQWVDPRLKYEDPTGYLKYLTLIKSKQIWEPDLFFSNENDGHFHDIMKPNLYYRIFRDGTVLYSRRLSLTLGCPMNLRLYPFDRQICSIRMASYGYSIQDLKFVWKEYDPVQVVRNLYLAKFTLEKFSTDHCNSKTNTGEYSCLKVDFQFKRNIFCYLMQIYLPSIMLVMISFSSFWFNPTAIQSRMLLGISTLFVLAIHTLIVNSSIPEVSYTKSIDIWSGVCLLFVFLAYLEFATVHYVYRSKFYNPVGRKPEVGDLLQNELGNEVECENAFTMKSLNRSGEPLTLENKCTIREQFRNLNCCQFWFKKFSHKSKAIDVLSRILFPSSFLLFNCIYWLYYAI